MQCVFDKVPIYIIKKSEMGLEGAYVYNIVDYDLISKAHVDILRTYCNEFDN